jgi:hypothetical protein
MFDTGEPRPPCKRERTMMIDADGMVRKSVAGIRIRELAEMDNRPNIVEQIWFAIVMTQIKRQPFQSALMMRHGPDQLSPQRARIQHPYAVSILE